MFKPNNSTITRNMHKVSLWNYATGLPHQRELKLQGHAHLPRPLGHKHAGLATSPNPAGICPFCEGKKKEQRFTSRHLHETGTRGDQGPHTCCFAGSHTAASMPLLRGGPTTHPHLPHFLATPKKPYLKWKIPQEVASKLDDAKWRHS